MTVYGSSERRGFAFFMSNRAIRIPERSTNAVPTTVNGLMDSLNMSIPANTPVIGSKVLRMEARLPPIRNVPRWNSATAPAFTMQAKPTDRSHPDRVCGRASCFVRRQTRNRRTDAMADTQKLKPNTDPFSCL